jgi:hypothetical protein
LRLLLNRAARVTVGEAGFRSKSPGVRFASALARKPVVAAVRYRWKRSSPVSPRNVRVLARVVVNRARNSSSVNSRRCRRVSAFVFCIDRVSSGFDPIHFPFTIHRMNPRTALT